MKRILAAVAMALLSACGGGTSGSSDGNVDGIITNGSTQIQIQVAEGDSLSYTGSECGGGSGQESFVGVSLSDRGGMCLAFEGGSTVGNSNNLLLAIAGSPASSGSAPPAIGIAQYTIGNPLVDSSGNTFAASANLVVYDGSCTATTLSATQGIINVQSNSGGVIGGFFNGLEFSGASGSLSGSFDAPACTITSAQFCALGTPNGCSP